jgi:hypothetical protein
MLKKINAKRLFYIFICLSALISGFIFLLTIKANNRKFNQNLLTNIESLYGDFLKNNTIYNDAILQKSIKLII